MRRFAQHPERDEQDAGLALTIQTISAVLVTLVIALAAPLLLGTVVAYPLLLAGLLPVLGSPAKTVLLSSFRGRERHGSYAWANACFVVTTVCSLVLVLLAGRERGGGDRGREHRGRSHKRRRVEAVRPAADPAEPTRDAVERGAPIHRRGLPFLSWQVTSLVYGYIDRILLGMLVPTSQVGWYAAAYQICAIVVFVPTLVIGPLFPALSRSVHDAPTLRRTITQTLRTLLIIMGLLAVSTVIAAPGVPRLFGWPDDFSNAVPLMTILALHLPIVACDMVLATVLMAIHRESRLIVVGLVAVLFNVGANLIAISFFQDTLGNGAIGSSIVTVLTEILMCIGAVMLVPKHLLDASVVWQSARLGLSGIVAALVGLAALEPLMASLAVVPALAIAGTVGALVYVGGAMLLRAITTDDVAPLVARVRKGRTMIRPLALRD